MVHNLLYKKSLPRPAASHDGGVEVFPGEKVETDISPLHRLEGNSLFVDKISGQGQEPQKIVGGKKGGRDEGGADAGNEVQKCLREPQILDVRLPLVSFEHVHQGVGFLRQLLFGFAENPKPKLCLKEGLPAQLDLGIEFFRLRLPLFASVVGELSGIVRSKYLPLSI